MMCIKTNNYYMFVIHLKSSHVSLLISTRSTNTRVQNYPRYFKEEGI